MAKQVFHASKSSSFSAGIAAENERRGWTEETYIRKNLEPHNHYDWSRHDLNFEICDGKIIPLGSQEKSLYDRYQEKLAELDFKQYKAGASNQKNTYVDFILGGSAERMQELTYDEIKEWAMDSYNFCREKYGEGLIGFEVHLDESETNIHAHCNIIPIAIVNQRGNVSGYHEVDENGDPVRYTKGKHIGEIKNLSTSKYNALPEEKKRKYRKNERGKIKTVSFDQVFGSSLAERSRILSQLHDEYYEAVGRKWGLDRGDQSNGSHLSKKDYAIHQDFRKEKKRIKKDIEDAEKEKKKLETAIRNLKVEKAIKEKLLGILKQSSKDEAIKALRNQIERMEKHARGEEGRKLSALAGAVIPLEEEIKRLKDENADIYKLAQINVVEKVKHAAGLYVKGSNGHETPEDIGKAWKRKFNEVKNLQQQNDKLLEEKKSLIDSFLNLPIIKKLIEIIQKALNDYDYEFCGEDRTYISNMIKGDSYQEEKSIAEKLFDSIIDLLKMAGEHIRQTWLDVTRRSFVEIADDRWGGEEIEQSRSLRL